MKNQLGLMCAILLFIYNASAQNSAGIGTEEPNPNAVLELVSPTADQGLLVPRLTTEERTAPAFTSKLSITDQALFVYDLDEKAFFFWTGTSWSKLADSQQVPISLGQLDNDTGYITDPADADADPQNEIQDLVLDGSSLSITGKEEPTIINLSAYQGTNTDNQTLSLDGTLLSITGGNEIDISPVDSDNEIQSLDFTSGFLSLSSDPNETVVDLNGYLTTELDGDPENEMQDISLSGTNLSITGGSTVDLSPLQDFGSLNNVPAGLADGDDIGASGTGFLVLTGGDFQLYEDSKGGSYQMEYGDNNAYIGALEGSGTITLYAPLNVPHGSEIVSMTVTGETNGTFDVAIYSYALGAESISKGELPKRIETSTITVEGQLKDFTRSDLKIPVDKRVSTYFLLVTVPNPFRLYQVVLEYQYNY